MTIAIDQHSAQIVINSRPVVNAPTVAGARASFTCSNITATGTVRLTGAAGDNPAGWVLGFIQAQWIETNWVYYQGQARNNGSLLLQRGKPPARPAQGCRDTVNAVGAIWYNAAQNGAAAAGMGFPLTLTANFFDQPSDGCQLMELNGMTGVNNFLHEAQFEFHFCTVLAVRDPANTFHQLMSFYWNARWQARFQPPNAAAPGAPHWTITPVAAGTGSNVGHIIRGQVTDARFSNLIIGPAAQSCNQIFQAAEAAVEVAGGAGRRESPVWHDFPVGR